MAEQSKEPDSRNFLVLQQGDESPGPRMWAWVRIPLLKMGSIPVPPVGLGVGLGSLSQGIKKLDSNRMAERSKAPDSKNFLLLSQGDESSGPRMWARVRIPHLTMGSILVPPVGLGSAR
ncbi:hypothetical protein AVEN_47432-1 [Araneus ventricosus]|uniref:Uncharacterized protein n=1 Tax=Araneus ventricosus TaxID=182803 RepID=A0A4Y2U9I0_ARAVE|nr:hypothetical protein AVEN_47432-1 [Araneus ventricosus]